MTVPNLPSIFALYDLTHRVGFKNRSFVVNRIGLGKRPVLTGGGLIRSMGGRKAVKFLRRSRIGDDDCRSVKSAWHHAVGGNEGGLSRREIGKG